MHWHIPLDTAIVTATRAADEACLPMTVYRDADTCGWAHHNPFAQRLGKPGVEMDRTILPERYFR